MLDEDGKDRDPGDEVMARLYELSGRPPALSVEELAPIKADLRRAWRRSLERAAARRRRRYLGLAAAAAALALALGLALYRGPAPGSDDLATLEVESGAVTFAGGGPESLPAGATIVTGDDGHVGLRLAAGPSLRLAPGSAVRLAAAQRVRLERGALYIDSGPAAAGGDDEATGDGVEVVTALGTVRELGTQFEVGLLPDPAAEDGEPAPLALRVRVREGAVEVEHGDRRLRAEAGSVLTLTADGEVERDAVAADAGEWRWVQRAAVPMAIEGATLAAFLDWVARESGRPWRFASEVPPSAGATVLHGSIGGLTPEQALAVVLPSCRLRHRVEDGRLRIEPAASPG